jgi:hypothetical protein
MRAIMKRKVLLLLTLCGLLALGPTPIAAQSNGSNAIVVTTLCAGASAIGTCGTIHGPLNGRLITIYVETSAGVGAGTVIIEEASSDSFAGTWSQIGTISTTIANQSTATHVVVSIYGAIRVRISATVTGGTVTVTSLLSN